MNKKLTILITGGHVTPAAAVLEFFRDKYPDSRVIYVGRKHTGVSVSVEKAEIEARGGEFAPIIFGKFHRFLTVRQIGEFGKMPLGLAEALRVLLKFRPGVVISFGGYISVPVILAAKLVKIPIVMHEQTAAWGAANRFLMKMADKIAVSWPGLHIEGKTIFTGNPIRKEILNLKRKKLFETSPAMAEGSERRRKVKKILYIIGGNQGSETIDRAVIPLLPELTSRYTIFHQTQNINSFRGKDYFSAPWFDTPRHAQIMSKADLSISRAGANTITELAYAGIPAILIPLPYAGANEQLKNAEILAESGLGQIITQKLLSTNSLREAIKRMEETENWEEARKNAKKLVKIDAAERLAETAIKLACEK